MGDKLGLKVGNILFAILPPLPLLGWQIVILLTSTTICHPRGGRIERWQIVVALYFTLLQSWQFTISISLYLYHMKFPRSLGLTPAFEAFDGSVCSSTYYDEC